MVNIVTVHNKSELQQLAACGICHDFVVECHVIDECYHQFCKKCILHSIEEEGVTHCPVCDTWLGASPHEKLRSDEPRQDMLNDLFSLEGKILPSATGPSTRKVRSLEALVFGTPSVPTQARTTVTAPNKNQNMSTPKKSVGRPKKVPRNPVGRPRKAPLQVKDSTAVQAEAGTSAQRGVGTGRVWFKPVALAHPEGDLSLPQIDAKFVKIDDGVTATVSIVQKYIAAKLALTSAKEVKISCNGKLFPPETPLKNVLCWWLENIAPTDIVTKYVGAPAGEFIMELNYARRLEEQPNYAF